jgi:hypothetical protein
VEHLRREVAWGSAYTSFADEEGSQIRGSITELCITASGAASVVEETIRVCYNQAPLFGTGSTADPSRAVEMKKELVKVDHAIHLRLQRHLDHSGVIGQMMIEGASLHESWNMCLLLVSLLQARCMITSCRHASDISSTYRCPRIYNMHSMLLSLSHLITTTIVHDYGYLASPGLGSVLRLAIFSTRCKEMPFWAPHETCPRRKLSKASARPSITPRT